MKKTKLILVVLLAVVMIFALSACTDPIPTPLGPTPSEHTCQNVCPTCGKCTNADCTEDVCADKCAGHGTVELPVPVITVVPSSVEMNAGEDIDLMFGVSVTGGTNPTVIISNDDDFDADTEGTYTITYTATNDEGQTSTATRTITVNKALSSLTLEVRANYLGENKWQGNLISFENALYVELNADTTIETATSGVFYNNSASAITLNMAGSYGCSAVIDANGVVLEGRDGANSKLVNAENPTRTGSSVTKITVNGEEVSVSSAFAKELVVPAGGYAVIIQNGYLGTTADTDGRGYMNYNVIYAYGNVVRLYWTDTNEELTTYVNQAPTVSGNTKILVPIDDASFSLDSAVVAGITAKDDNGTFATADDVTLETITVVDNGGFDISTAGVYTVKLSVTDGTLTTEFTREVEVKSEGIATAKVGEKELNIPVERIAIDQDLTGIGNYAFLVYTKAYTKNTVDFASGYGIAFVLDEYGQIVRIYDGANAKYWDATHNPGVSDSTLCTANGYIGEALASRSGDEIVIIAPNSSVNNAAGGSRDFLNNAKVIGARFSLTGLTFKALDTTITINGKSFTAAEGKWVLNSADVTTSNAATYSMIIYTKDFTGSFTTNGYGAAIVLNQYGELVKVYDGANGGFYTKDGKATGTLTFNVNTYATVAFSELADGEILIILPNDGTNGADSARTFGLGLRTDGSIGQIATLTGFTFPEKPRDVKTITIDDKTFTADEGKWAYNSDSITASNAANYSMIIFTKDYTGTVATNGFGAALVINQYGVLVKIYDGANGGFYTVDGKSSETLTFTTSNYATVAFSELADGEILVIFPNDAGSNASRGWALGLRGVNGARAYCGETVTLTGIEFKEDTSSIKYVHIGENTMQIDPTNVYVNDNTTTTAVDGLYVYTTAYVGKTPFANTYGQAFVIKDGKIVRIYDGVNNKYFDTENTSGVADSTIASTYLQKAIASLSAGEYVVVAPNAGDKTFRTFFTSNRSIGATFSVDGVELTASDKTMTTLVVNNNVFCNPVIVADAEVQVAKLAETDFAVYSHGYNGVLIKNGWCEILVIDANGTVIRVYDGFNGKYYDANNTSGIARTDDLYALATMTHDVFNSLKAGETMLVGFNGGLNGNAGRTFLLGNRVVGATVVLPVTSTASTTNVSYATITIDGKTFFVDASKVVVDAEHSATPAFAIYNYGYTGTRYTGSYGVALIVDKATGKTVKVYDGASGKYWDAENSGVTGICTATGYAEEAFQALEEGQYVIIAPNGGLTGNVARGFLYGYRAVDKAVSYALPIVEE